jgi:asparagine synthase (glutamine-hydrolysing)
VKEAGVTVALSGLGGDELFAGYSTFRRALRLKEMQSVPRALRSPVSQVGASLSTAVRQRKFWQLLASDGSAGAAYAVARQLFAPDQVVRLSSYRAAAGNGNGAGEQALVAFNDGGRVARGPSKSGPSQSGARKGGSGKSAKGSSPADTVNEISLLELKGYMANTLLRDTDFMSMAHSLEVRVPFVDSAVADYVLGLPGKWKLNGSRPKPLLADVLGDLLPAKFLGRSKMGFTLPFDKWLQSGLRDQVSQVLRDSERVGKSGLDPESVRGVWERFERSPASIGWSRPWSLYVLAQWCELNRVTN